MKGVGLNLTVNQTKLNVEIKRLQALSWVLSLCVHHHKRLFHKTTGFHDNIKNILNAGLISGSPDCLKSILYS